jgi:hypothetical protein
VAAGRIGGQLRLRRLHTQHASGLCRFPARSKQIVRTKKIKRAFVFISQINKKYVFRFIFIISEFNDDPQKIRSSTGRTTRPHARSAWETQFMSLNILCISWGTTGNLSPVLTAARQLNRAGHQPRVMADPAMRSEVEAAGFPFIGWRRAPTGSDADPADFSDLADWLRRAPTRPTPSTRSAAFLPTPS